MWFVNLIVIIGGALIVGLGWNDWEVTHNPFKRIDGHQSDL